MHYLTLRRVGALLVVSILLTLAVLAINAASVTAAPHTSGGITTDVILSEATIARGNPVTIVVEAKSEPSRRVNLRIEVIAPDSSVVFQQIHNDIHLIPGFPRDPFSDWNVPSNAALGAYMVQVKAYDRDSGALLHTNSSAATINVIASGGGGGSAPSSAFEVWTTVQGLHEIHVLAPVNGQADNLEVVATIDYKELTAPGGLWAGTPMLNPHMVLFGLHGNPGSKYAFVSNVSSHNTAIIHADSREVVDVIPTGWRTHASQVAPNGQRALVAAIGADGINGCRQNFVQQCGQIAEIITDLNTGTFTLGRTYNFSDFPAGSGWEGLPRFDPICASFTPDSRFAYVTLWSGGLVVFEINENPAEPLFDVVRVFPAGTGRGEVAPNGCGVGYSTDGRLMFANSATPQASFYYTFNLRTHRMIRHVNVSNIIQDIHGMMLSPRGDEVVMVGRLSDNFIVLNQKSGALKRNRGFDLVLGNGFVSSWTQQQEQLAQSSMQTIAFTSESAANSFYCALDYSGVSASSGMQSIMQQAVDPAPDLVDFSPDGRYIFVSLRGPNPATGAHAIGGTPPGVVVIDFMTGQTVQVVELPGNQSQQDPHGLAVRRLP